MHHILMIHNFAIIDNIKQKDKHKNKYKNM